MKRIAKNIIGCALGGLMLLSASAQRIMEKLDRGLIAIPVENGVFVSWRLLASDPQDVKFNLYRFTGQSSSPVKLNSEPIASATCWTDSGADRSVANTYFVRAVVNNEEDAGARFTIAAGEQRPYLSIPLQTPKGYTPNDASVGDLDGDGVYEIILHQTGIAKDNSHPGFTSPPVIQAYKLDGTLLWTINLGKNIREGAHYTQFMVYDFDGDGRAEVAMKTADGTIDGKGKVIGDSSRDWRNENGHIISGPEFLTIFDGRTGAEIHTVNYIPARHPSTITPSGPELKAIWGDDHGNRSERFLACVAYLDGVHPSLVMARGYYTRTVLAAWDLVDGKLRHRWTFDSDDGNPENWAYRGQGNHNLSVADVDGDGKDEIVYGAMVIDDNGKGLYSTGLGHGDALHVSDLDPERPGLEVFDIQERFDDAGAHFRDAATGEILWKKPSLIREGKGQGPGRGLALDIDPRYPGFECWATGAGLFGIFDAKGNRISNRTPPCNMGIYWDGDLLRELLNGVTISKWDYEREVAKPLFDGRRFNCVSNNGTKSNPCLSVDLFGDWREELICRTADNNELRIFTTSIPTKYRFVTFMHDPQYRLSIAWQNVGYNQPPHLSFFFGEGMNPPPAPNILLK